MNKYLITYELKSVDKSSYAGLYEAIKGISGYWWHFIDSTWMIKNTPLNANLISERLRPHINQAAGDYLLVIKVDSMDKQGLLPRNAWDWLNDTGTPLADAQGKG